MERPALRTRGLSLAEVLVTSFLMTLLLGLAVAFLIPTLRAQTRGAVAAGLQEQAVLALNRVAMRLQQSSAPGISLYNRNPGNQETYPAGYSEAFPVVLAVVAIKSVLQDTQLDWSDRPQALFFDRAASQLRAVEWPTTPPPLSVTLTSAGPTRLTDADLLSLAQPTTGGTHTNLGRDVAYFDVAHSLGRGSAVGNLLTITILLRSGQSQSFRMQRQVHLRN